MFPSTNTRSGSTDNNNTSNEATIIPNLPLSYLNQTDFSTTFEKILSSFNDNNVKQYAKPKEIISEQDSKFDAKFENQLHTLSHQIQ